MTMNTAKDIHAEAMEMDTLAVATEAVIPAAAIADTN
jgi:hypothetical protein